MGFDKTELIQRKRKLVQKLKTVQIEIDFLEEQFEDYIQYLGDEEKESQLENWEHKEDDLFDLKEAVNDWLKKSKSIK